MADCLEKFKPIDGIP